MTNDRIPKVILKWNVEGRVSKGKSREERIDGVSNKKHDQ